MKSLLYFKEVHIFSNYLVSEYYRSSPDKCINMVRANIESLQLDPEFLEMLVPYELRTEEVYTQLEDLLSDKKNYKLVLAQKSFSVFEETPSVKRKMKRIHDLYYTYFC
ncbi:MAG: hypothetical protein ACRCZB_05540 [Bacteroidales bacterium]